MSSPRRLGRKSGFSLPIGRTQFPLKDDQSFGLKQHCKTVGIDLGREVEIELSDETKIMDREVKSTASFEFGYLYRF
mgnify:CR=1 FL=1